MKKKIVITDSDGKETVVEGNFDKAVNVRLETEPEKYWFSTGSFVSSFYTKEQDYWDAEYKVIHADTKKQAVLNYIHYLFDHLRKFTSYDSLKRHVNTAMEELKNHE